MSINEIASLVLKVICFVAVVVVIPVIKRKYSKQQIDSVIDTIQTFVEAAEQIFPKDQGAEKKQWVRDKLKAAGYDVDTDRLDAEIESMVFQIHSLLKQ